jgi:hypothetical protein
MLAVTLLVATMATSRANVERSEAPAFQLTEESPDVFLAKATLQQYLSRVVRKDWDAARRLTHPKALQAQTRRRFQAGVAPWTDGDTELKAFRFVEARQIAPGVVAVQVGEDSLHPGDGQLASDDAVYLLFKSRGSFLVGDKKPSFELAEVTEASVRRGYPGFVDGQVQAQAQAEAQQAQGRRPEKRRR